MILNKSLGNVYELFMKENQSEIDPNILKEIIEAVRKMKYGEVVITIHNSKVVQIEEKKKKRFQ